MSFAAALPERYRVILCDIWGVVHDGVDLYPGAAERLRQWRSEGRRVILITNAPRTAQSVEQQLARIGLPRDAWDGISTSGEAGIAALTALDTPVGFLGTEEDRAILDSRGVRFAVGEDFGHLACTGLETQSMDIAPYDERLQRWAGRGVTMHCLNPDRLVIRGGTPEACAGALADVYERLGGTVEWYGKPHETIYRHALGLAGDPPPEAVLAIGDSLKTDVLGAARMGFDCLFVTGGIHAGEPFPSDFAGENGLGDWQPVAIAASLA
ncbi:MAG TPA: TIGR01459 family HAD-type hydrolase [Sphingomicrobium sp.]|nr:TIGR01459 family HAD-type hydrolase [Sphingomicrobium sp.]